MLYVSLCRKLNDSTLAHYHRWMFENGRWESVETLKEFIVQEAEFQIVASETIRGVSAAYMSRPCKVCNGPHGVWRCEKFKAMSIQER